MKTIEIPNGTAGFKAIRFEFHVSDAKNAKGQYEASRYAVMADGTRRPDGNFFGYSVRECDEAVDRWIEGIAKRFPSQMATEDIGGQVLHSVSDIVGPTVRLDNGLEIPLSFCGVEAAVGDRVVISSVTIGKWIAAQSARSQSDAASRQHAAEIQHMESMDARG